MFNLLLVVLAVVVLVLSVVVAVLVKGNASLKAQHGAYVAAVNSVYDNHSNVIIGLQGEIEELLERRANDKEVINSKDLHIAGLVKEIGLKEKTINDLSFRNEALELRVKEVCSTSDELYQALKEATK
jgi:peptidoglycan hydrolase CwlO-like protein